ncbi:glutaredoxin [Sarocladium strictum]
MAVLQEITSKAMLLKHKASIPSSTTLLVYYHLPDNSACKPLTSTIADIASQHGDKNLPQSFLSIASVDVSTTKNARDKSEKYGVSSVPYIVFTRDGRLRQAMTSPSPEKLRGAVDQQLTAAGVQSSPASPPTNPLAKVVPPNECKGENLHDRLTTLTSYAPVVVFIKGTPQSPACRFSRRMVNLLDDHKVSYSAFNILADEEVRQGLKDFGDWPTFPQVWIDGKLAGGLDVIRDEIDANPSFWKASTASLGMASNGEAVAA